MPVGAAGILFGREWAILMIHRLFPTTEKHREI
jgi:hypothetical protein